MKSNCSFWNSTVSNLKRRSFLGGAAALGGATLLPQSAFALTLSEARDLVDELVEEINAIINSGRSEAQMLDDFEDLFGVYANTQVIALRVLGADARSVSRAQINRFTDAFAGYISRKYGRRFREFIGGRVEVTDSREVNTWFEVRTIAHLQGVEPFRVDFLVKEAGGRDLFFDMAIEGISVTRVEREEIGAMLDARGGDLDAVSQALRDLG